MDRNAGLIYRASWWCQYVWMTLIMNYSHIKDFETDLCQLKLLLKLFLFILWLISCKYTHSTKVLRKIHLSSLLLCLTQVLLHLKMNKQKLTPLRMWPRATFIFCFYVLGNIVMNVLQEKKMLCVRGHSHFSNDIGWKDNIQRWRFGIKQKSSFIK